MNQLKSVYSIPFLDSYSHPIYTCLSMIASNESHVFVQNVKWYLIETYSFKILAFDLSGGGVSVKSIYINYPRIQRVLNCNSDVNHMSLISFHKPWALEKQSDIFR